MGVQFFMQQGIAQEGFCTTFASAFANKRIARSSLKEWELTCRINAKINWTLSLKNVHSMFGYIEQVCLSLQSLFEKGRDNVL